MKTTEIEFYEITETHWGWSAYFTTEDEVSECKNVTRIELRQWVIDTKRNWLYTEVDEIAPVNPDMLIDEDWYELVQEYVAERVVLS